MEKAVDAEGLGVELGEWIKIVKLGDDISSVQSLSCVQLFATPWTIQSKEISRPEYRAG